MKNLRFSLLAAIALAVSITAVRISSPPRQALTWDVFGYYLYLPATFIYHDPGLSNPQWLDEVMETYHPSATFYQLVEGSDGNRIIKYSSGLALLFAPFFFLAHFIAPLTGYPADGFSLPYQYILSAGGILWAIAGIFLLRKLLLKFFSDKVSAAVLLITIAGTNYFHLASLDGTLLTHNFLFTIYVALLLFTIRWHEKPSRGTALLIGLCCGLATLIRPSEAVCVIIPLLWNTGTKATRTLKIRQIHGNISHIAIALAGGASMVAIQLLYWKLYSGHWLFYSYDNPGEGFRFFPPYLTKFLFSFRKGWLIYTPLMIFALAGFYRFRKEFRPLFPAVLLFFVLSLWIISAWSCWWYAGGSFSARAIVPVYAVLALPLGALLTGLKKRWLIPAGVVISLLMVLNLFQSWQFHKGIIDKERMTRPYYLAIFGKTTIDREKLEPLLLVFRSTSLDEAPASLSNYRQEVLFDYRIENQTENPTVLDGNNPFFQGLDRPYRELTGKDHFWVRLRAGVLAPEDFSGEPPMLVAAFHHEGEAYKYSSNGLQKAADDSLFRVDFWYLSPEPRTGEDNLKVYLWSRDTARLVPQYLRIELWEPLKTP